MAKKTNTPTIGKVPPNDEALEQVVLGSIINERDAIYKVIKHLKSELFYKIENEIICRVILDMHSQYKKIDLLTLVSELKSVGKLEEVGGAYYITQLTDRVVSSSHIEEHVEILNSHYIAREQIRLYQEKISGLYDYNDPFDIASEVSSDLVAMQESTYLENEYTMKDLAMMSIDEREKIGSEKIDFIGYSSGLKSLDKVLLGIKAPDLTIIAGRPGMGKTAVALSLAKSLSKQTPVTIFSLEMSAIQLYKRLLSNESEISSRDIKTNNLSSVQREHLSAADINLSDYPIVINDTPAINIDRLRSLVMVHKRKYGTGAIIIDYLGLMKGNTKNQFNTLAEVTEITGKLKRVAKEFNIPVILLAQLSRDVEKRVNEGFKPKLSDLRDSGSIEQDADNVLFLWRPEYYKIDKPIPIREYNMEFSTHNLLVIIVAKCRDGETKNIPVYIDLSKMSIKDHPDLFFNSIEQGELPF